MLRFLTAGESHGRALVVIVEGLPAGLLVTAEDIQRGLARRRLGFGRGPRMRFEADEVTLVGGIRHGRTLGSPVAIEIANTEWPKWETEMSPAPGLPSKVLTQPRPGHADLSGMLKYGLNDARDVLERASARETAARVAAGTLAKLLLFQIGIDVLSHIVQLGPERAETTTLPTVAELIRVDESQVRCNDPDAEARMIAAVKAAAKDGDSLGGVAEVIAYGVPVGLGSHVHWDRRLDALLAQALMSIQAIKAVEFGDGTELAGRRGSEAHDAIRMAGSDPGATDAERDGLGGGYVRDTHHAGGVEGGISTGSPIVARATMKPLATLNRPTLGTVDVVSKEATVSFKERTDVTAVPAMGVVAETMVALVLASEALRKFGGDSVAEFRRNRRGYLDVWVRRLRRRSRSHRSRSHRSRSHRSRNHRSRSHRSRSHRSRRPMVERVILVGMMGAGKTTIGHLLAERLGWGHFDSDAQVMASTGSSVPELFAARGEEAFRMEESRVLAEACSSPGPVVVSAAGGVVLSEANRNLLQRSGVVVWLRADPRLLARRVGKGEGRPLLGEEPAASLSDLYDVRRPLYEAVAAVAVDVDGLTPDQVVDRLLAERVLADRGIGADRDR